MDLSSNAHLVSSSALRPPLPFRERADAGSRIESTRLAVTTPPVHRAPERYQPTYAASSPPSLSPTHRPDRLHAGGELNDELDHDERRRN